MLYLKLLGTSFQKRDNIYQNGRVKYRAHSFISTPSFSGLNRFDKTPRLGVSCFPHDSPCFLENMSHGETSFSIFIRGQLIIVDNEKAL